jgi:hypothetical protein
MKLGSFYLQMHALVRELIPDIADDYRAQDSEPSDETPAMTLTIGADCDGWSYQTGDNSFTGGAYSYREWSVVTLYRDSDPHEVAEEIISNLCSDDAEAIFPPIPKRNEQLIDVRRAVREPYTSVGGYPVYAVLAEDGMICADCVRDCYREISKATREGLRDGWRAADMPITVFYEGREQCSHCSKQLESAYGDPDTLEFFIGSHFLSALVNDDYTGINGAEGKALDAWVKEETEEFKQGHWSVTDETDEFGTCAITGQRGNVTKVQYIVMER